MAQQQPLVSIITIVYNGEKHIEQTILSVIRQTYKNIEYIVIDGGSKDGTMDIVKKYQSNLAYWKSERDRGISDAFNKGLRQAKGEIIGMLNADDWYEIDAVEKVVGAFTNADVVYGDLRLLKNGKTDFVLEGNHHFIEKEMTINHPTVFVRKGCYDKWGMFDENYKCAMDYDLLLKFYVRGAQFKHISAILANMRWEGLSDTKWFLGCKETLSIKNRYFPKRAITNRLYFYKHVLAIAIPKFLDKIKLNGIIRVYRSRFARVRKTYD